MRRSILLLACLAAAGVAGETDSPERPDPTKGKVRLPAKGGWTATLVIDNGDVGIWTVESYQVFPNLGAPEVVGLDDQGRCHVLVSYSGKWFPLQTIHDGKWLGGLDHGDVDPRVAGKELYAGSARGNIFQILAHEPRAIDNRLISHVPGREIHTLVAQRGGLLVFTNPPALYLVTPTGEHGTFETRFVQELDGLVRQAIRLPTGEIATVSRSGKVHLLSLDAEGAHRRLVYEAAMGAGRIAQRRAREGEPLVLYLTHDDGRVVRLERAGRDAWKSETIYLGPQGPRGVAAGRFDADLDVETVAVFGYSHKVQILSRRADGWHAETIFVDRDKGHWLAAAELDGRNATDELVASGYGGRVVQLSRPPGYGRSETTEPADAGEPDACGGEKE